MSLVELEAAPRRASSHTYYSIMHKLKGTLIDIFLPSGFPQTVSSDYLNYQIWDSLQALFSTINGLLTTQAMLTSMGVGKAEATASGALITWVLQDGTAMVGRILFSWRYAPRLDRDVKTWRLAADVFNDLGMLLCLLSPVFTMPEMTLLSMCVGSLFKALCGVSGAATKGSLTVHFAKSNNLADVSAKDGSQETIVNLVGMISGTYLVTAVDGIAIPFLSYQIPVAWLLFTLLTVLHLYCNYQAVKSVVLDTLNDQRYALLCQRYITSGDNKRRCLTPAEIAARYETIFWWHFAPERPLIVLGASLSDFSEGKLRKSNGDYVLQSTVSQGCCVPRRHIYIGLLAADDRTILRALFHAHWLTCGLNKRTVSSQQINQEFSQFLKSLRDNGWQLSGCCQFSDKGSRLAVVKND